MNVARQLFELQEVDIEIESKNLAIKEMTAQMGESHTLLDTRARLAEAKKQMEDLLREQHSFEIDIEDLTGKLKSSEKDLYSGRIHIPKELSSLQQDITSLKSRRTQLEDKALDIMEKVEANRGEVERMTGELKRIEAEWSSGQQKLAQDLEEVKNAVTVLTRRQQEMAGGIETVSLDLYRSLRKQKGTAVARVEQGICRGCRISLPVSELQLARSGQILQCSSCGRILYLP
jgi:predicted  nucleic acid-binding Zn-ribbon protein